LIIPWENPCEAVGSFCIRHWPKGGAAFNALVEKVSFPFGNIRGWAVLSGNSRKRPWMKTFIKHCHTE
jgi:hypothetical protein